MSARMTTLALVSAAGLLMSSCSFIGGSLTETEEPAFTEAAAESTTSSATTTSSKATSTSSSATSSSTNADCDEKQKLEDTKLSKVLENEEAYVKGSTEKFEDVSVGEDEYDPCKFLSYVVLEGEFDGEDVKVPVFFIDGEVFDEDALHITSTSFEVEEDGEGYTFESKTEGDIVGVEGKVYRRTGEAPSMETSFDGVSSDIFYIDVGSEPTESADLAEDEGDLRGEELFTISADGWNMVCGIVQKNNAIDCAHGDGGAWAIKGGKTPMPEGVEFNLVTFLPLEGSTEFTQYDDEIPTNGTKIEGNGLYRIGIGDIEAQIAVVDDGIIVSTPDKSRLMFTNDAIYFDNEDSGNNDSATETV
ncbi:hypothetical protein [Corynebacterium aurimucosum]|uniref:hypothetical protein n=1 Tax=Corynebacterium aurimucosum TaxID=169292 RepID=UPI000C801BEE|nr:hypothetical protein [Corynebacterium aurimucosum]PMC72155.1 hypothetical protein CJ201_00655 [Corynebacterium aurimucosum]